MEYLSIPHTRAATHHLIPALNDTLLTNLRTPILTLIEDSTPGAHDTLTAACDANLYAALGVENPEEHGSCAENLVLALKELNEGVGLKGQKAIGADVTVNNAPTPLHLFMNAPVEMEEKATSESGAGAKGITFRVEEPVGKKRGFVRFRAERDIVMVMSACPMDVGKQNGGRCMAANFVVEEETADQDQKGDKASSSIPSTKKASTAKQDPSSTPTPRKAAPKLSTRTSSQQSTPKPSQAPAPAMQKPFLKGGPNKFANINRRDSAAEAGAKIPLPPSAAASPSPAPSTPRDTATSPKKRPKKLERRSGTEASNPSTPKVGKTGEVK
jgi:uncharacterized protein YcgI (DUF1989 family)